MSYSIKYYFVILLAITLSNKFSYSRPEQKIDSLKILLEKESLPISEETKLLFRISTEEYHLQHYSEAISYAYKVLEIYRDNNDYAKESRILEYLGIYYAEFSDYQNSIKYLLEAIKIAEDIEDLKAINSLYLNIGTTFTEAGSNNKGIKFLKKAVKYYKQDQTNNLSFLIAGYTNLGVAYDGLSLLDSAMFYYQKAISIARLQSKNPQIGAPMLNIGDIYFTKNNIPKAFEHYQLALKAFDKSRDIRGIWHTNFGLARVYAKQGDTKDAIILFEDCIIHFKETNDLTYWSKCLIELSNIYNNQANYKLSLDYTNQLLDVKDSISKSEVLNKIADLELHYKIEKLQKENQSALRILMQKKKISTLWWYIATGILFIIIILIVTLYNRSKTQKALIETQLKNTQLEQGTLTSELNFRNTELENFALHIVQKNEFLLDIKQKIKKLRNNASIKDSKEITELSIKINQSLRINKELEKFSERVDDVNSHFFRQLSDKYPNLTEKEKRLCALLKLNLSSKEIASLNNISEGAVTMARYRLRKKIGLTNDENLAELFQKIC